MVTQVAWIAHMHKVAFKSLWYFLRRVDEEELDWRIHPDANTMRRILAHLHFVEEVTADIVTGEAAPGAHRDPKTYEPRRLAELRALHTAAFERTQAGMGGLTERDLLREVDMLGVRTATLNQVLENHVTHTAGHMYQIRLIRGTYSRAHHTDKSKFDPW
jgi:uncharacterized damage-inducible protein DinB